MKGFIGGFPVALLAVAAQAKYAERHGDGFYPQAGGTAIGGPSGNDDDGGFVSPYSVNIKTDTQVNEWNQDDHHIDIKHKNVYHGPFGKRGAPVGGTAIGGPSGNDEGQSFDMPITGIFNTQVNDFNKDDHSIEVKHKDVHPAPYFGPPHGGHRGPAGPDGFEKRFGPHPGGTAIGGPGGGSHRPHGPEYFRPAPQGGTAIGGPSGNDGGQSFSAPITIVTTTGIDEHNEDDHSIKLKHEDVYVPPHHGHFRRSENFGPPHQGGPPHGGPHGGPPPGAHFEPHPESHYEPHTSSHFEPHPEPHYESHSEPHYENHPEPHVENHPEPHFAPHYSPHYEPHYEPHTSLENEITSLKNVNNGPAAGSIKFGRRGGPPGPHFEPHPESHYAPHTESHFEPHPEPHYQTHSEPHYENHPEPHIHNHPEPHYEPHYSPHYEPHYEPHHSLKNEITALEDVNNGPSAGSIQFGRRGFPAPPAGHFEPHPESHFEPHTESHIEPHPEPHYESHSEPHFENHPEPHVENHPEPHFEPHYSPSYAPHYAPHTSVDTEFTALHGVNNGPAVGSVPFARRAFAPTRETSGGGGGTAIGGPSGDDEGTSFSAPTNVDVDTGVNEHNEDDHSIEAEYEHVHAPEDHHESYYQAPKEAPSAGFTPQEESTARENHVDTPQCAAQVHEVVRTVTKTQYKTAEATRVVYQSAPVSESSAVVLDPNMLYAPSASAPIPSAVRSEYSYASQRPHGQAPSYSMIAVHVPMATPASSGAYSMATPSNSMGKMMPSGVSPQHLASPSSSAHASASHGVMFTGDAARLSGGIVSAAAAVMGVLAFII
ncbi:uncharacterized protein N7515_006324 [Penicillium bovifimosum]|uniref:GPI anchored protein n=1 Tax=Penicillium bovifimosum TaxID=126998 RepID=A0A9W9GUE9_9EURO|nr:uncharacterized protein N7515_006324 [Penicillium bovifimosum]KAJ5130285.1 hypothetical protein N7515_006324 [Penicillium bovifimosum]